MWEDVEEEEEEEEERWSALFGLFARREISWNNTRRGRENAREKLTQSICRGRAAGGGETDEFCYASSHKFGRDASQYLILPMKCRDAVKKKKKIRRKRIA